MKHHLSAVCLISIFSLTLNAAQAESVSCVTSIEFSTLVESAQKTPEISTAELRQKLDTHSATVFDARPHLEYAISHIPGAVNVSAKPGASKALYISDVAEIGRLQKGDKKKPVVVYCNGPHCGKAKRLGEELTADGYTDVKRYQLGIPVWRALGYPTQIEADGAAYVYGQDKTAVWIDVRDAAAFGKGSLTGARNLPAVALNSQNTDYQKDNDTIKQAKEDGRLPMNDHNTRIIVYGQDGKQAQRIAAMIAKEAFHNVSFFDGSYQQLRTAVEK